MQNRQEQFAAVYDLLNERDVEIDIAWHKRDEHVVFIDNGCSNAADWPEAERYAFVRTLAQDADLPDWKADDWFVFGDEYTLCDHCSALIRTEPDCYGWQADHFVNDDGYTYCRDCTDAADVIAQAVDHNADARRAPSNILEWVDPAPFGFAQIGGDFENGLHEHMADDPQAIKRWAIANGLDIVFKIEPSQFYVNFTVWVRKAADFDADARPLTEGEIESVQNALLAGEGEIAYLPLRAEFTEHPTPAERCKAALQGAQIVM